MEWIAGTIVGVLSLIGIGKIFEMLFRERIDQRKKLNALNLSNEGKMLDADQIALEMLHKDVETLKEDLKTVQNELAAVKDDRANLRAENTILKASENTLKVELERQAKRLHKFAEDLTHRDVQIAELNSSLLRREKEIMTLKSELHEVQMDLNRLMREIHSNTQALKPNEGC